MTQQKRKICFVITSYIHYSRNFLILNELKKRPDVDLHIVVGGAALLSKYLSKFTDIRKALREEGFDDKNISEVHFNLEGSEGVTKAKTAGLGMIEFSSVLQMVKPDLVLVRGDRFEVLSAAATAAYMNIPVAHIEGGDVSGTIDESVRHAVTKLSHIHFATNDDAKKRILRMGEDPNYVFQIGSPDVELVRHVAENEEAVDLAQTGSGAPVSVDNEYVMVMYHPVSSEVGMLAEKTNELLHAVHEVGVPALWFWPNFDAGAEEISHELRRFRDNTKDHSIRFMRYLPPKVFLSLLKNTKALIGNSSAGIKECSYLGIPVVNTGSRQHQRLTAENVLSVDHTKDAIKEAIEKQLSVGRYPQSDMYYADGTAKRIAEITATAPLYVQKRFVDK